MAQDRFDLISMADIARLAGQSRATVGNWKSRNPDSFPPERGRTSRGPLYDRAEVTAWLEATNRLDARSAEVTVLWRLADQLRGALSIEDTMLLLLVLLAVMATAPESEWRQFLAAPSLDLHGLLRSTINRLFPFAGEIVPLGTLPTRQVAEAIATLSTMDRTDAAVMANTLLEQAVKDLGRRGGEALTPPSIRSLVVAIAEPTGTVYNPGSGLGQLLIDAATASSNAKFTGQEVDRRIWAMAQLNLAIHGVAADIALGDVFAEDHFPQLLADRVISVPPWSNRFPVLDALRDDPRWTWGEPGSNDGNVAWIQHCLAHLADDGRAVLVLGNGALFEPGRAGRIRQRLVTAGLLEAVIALPPGLFASTGMPRAVVVLAKGRSGVGDEPPPTLMVDLTGRPAPPGGRASALDDGLIDEVRDLYHGWVGGRQPGADYAAAAAFDDIANNDFVIDPSRYVPLANSLPDLDDATISRSRLTEHLKSLVQASRDADDKLQAILGEPR